VKVLLKGAEQKGLPISHREKRDATSQTLNWAMGIQSMAKKERMKEEPETR
jgi:hypothetical protein